MMLVVRSWRSTESDHLWKRSKAENRTPSACLQRKREERKTSAHSSRRELDEHDSLRDVWAGLEEVLSRGSKELMNLPHRSL